MREIKGEIDLIGYDGETLAFVEVRTRTALPELSVTAEKQHLVGRTARRFLMERHVKECPVGFDVVAIEEFSGPAAVVRLLLARGCKKAHWKSRRNHRNAVI
jgi:putative endonuclease